MGIKTDQNDQRVKGKIIDSSKHLEFKSTSDGTYKAYSQIKDPKYSPFTPAKVNAEDTADKNGLLDGLTCEHCSYTSRYKANLTLHIESVHNKIRNFKCDECSQSFAQNIVLQRHVKAKHTNVRDWSCEECDYAAFKKQDLVRH